MDIKDLNMINQISVSCPKCDSDKALLDRIGPIDFSLDCVKCDYGLVDCISIYSKDKSEVMREIGLLVDRFKRG